MKYFEIGRKREKGRERRKKPAEISLSNNNHSHHFRSSPSSLSLNTQCDTELFLGRRWVNGLRDRRIFWEKRDCDPRLTSFMVWNGLKGDLSVGRTWKAPKGLTTREGALMGDWGLIPGPSLGWMRGCFWYSVCGPGWNSFPAKDALGTITVHLNVNLVRVK